MAFYDDVHATQKFREGTRVKDVAHNEYIYLNGVANTAVGSWVSFDEAHVSILAVADAIGRVAIARSAVVASNWGWFGIYGSFTGLALTGFNDDAAVYLTGTAGSVDDTDVAGDAVVGAWGRSAVNETTLLATFEISYPIVTNIALD